MLRSPRGPSVTPSAAAPHTRQTTAARSSMRSLLAAHQPLEPAKCYLVGVGPGSIDHVTIKAARIVSAADVIVYDDLGTQELLALAPAGCELLHVGKRGGQPSAKQADINSLLVRLCKQGKAVVRLKGGCCSTFSRVSGEAAALAAANIQFELLPGASSATAAPVLAGFPLTDTQLAGAYAVVSGHDAGSIDWRAFSSIPTVVVLMAGRQLATITQQLQATGWAASTPVAIIREAGLPSQQAWFSTLSAIESDSLRWHLPSQLSPCVVVVGQVAGLPAAWRALQQPDAQQ